MSFKPTKVTAPPPIKKICKSTVPVNTTGEASPESKNSSYEKGLWAEAQVIRHFHSLQLLKQRWRTPFAEVDLVFQKDEKTLLLVEVKSLTSFDFLPHRIGRKQKGRLFRAYDYLQSRTTRLIEMNWAFVTDDGHVLVIEDISS